MSEQSPLTPRELVAVLDTLVVLNGQAAVAELPLDLLLHVHQRLVRSGVLAADQPVGDVTDVWGAVIQRLHQLTADHEVPQHPAPVVNNCIAFADAETATAFADAMRALGKDVDAPVHEEAFRRWTVLIRIPRSSTDEHIGVAGQEALAGHQRGGWHLGAR